MSERDRKLESLGYPLEHVPKPGGVYRAMVVDQGIAHLSGVVPAEAGELKHRGKLGAELGTEEGQRAAALCAANLLRVARDHLRTLDEVERVLKLTGFVNSDPAFTEQHIVVNGASELIRDVLGEEAGLGARSAVGVGQLPLGSAVETEMILKVRG